MTLSDLDYLIRG